MKTFHHCDYSVHSPQWHKDNKGSSVAGVVPEGRKDGWNLFVEMRFDLNFCHWYFCELIYSSNLLTYCSCVQTDKSSVGAGCGSSKSYRCHISPGSGALLHNSSQSVTSKRRDVPTVVAACMVRRWRCVWMRCHGYVDAVAIGDGCQYVTATDWTTDPCACREFVAFRSLSY